VAIFRPHRGGCREEAAEKARISPSKGIKGIKIKVGQPDISIDLKRVETLRKELGDSVPIMIDANQQWDRVMTMRFGRSVEPFNAYDAEGHTHDIIQPDTPRLGGVTPFLKLTNMPLD
jgi:L-alanine-DL-glutamate epimerase-like enolase superfamily enzyme